LQFPVVFVPSLRKGGIREGAPYIYYDVKAAKMMAEFSDTGEAAAKAKAARENEKSQEAVRNFYVAVTRPERRLYLNYYPKRDTDPAEEIVLSAIQQKTLPANIWVGDTPAVDERSANQRSRFILPNSYEKWDAPFPQSWTQKSFSSIDKSIHEYEGDGGKAVEESSFPPSPQAGTLLHSLLENLDFTLPQEQMNAGLAQALQNVNGMTEARIAWAQELVWTVLHKELPHLGTSLSQVPQASCHAEMDFLMRMAAEENQVSTRAILKAMPKEIRFASKRDLGKEFYGFLNGQIDLFFESGGKTYVLDWKSNNLPSYGKEQLETSMKRHNYHLQYGVYCVAAKRYLERIGKNFDTDFGGVYYLFLRGIQEGAGSEGIFYQPTESLNWIHGLDELLNSEAK
jgi:ATP-dependent exoDNAse (exonuclease V) beta subunit